MEIEGQYRLHYYQYDPISTILFVRSYQYDTIRMIQSCILNYLDWKWSIESLDWIQSRERKRINFEQ